MAQKPSLIERAFQLARSGECPTVTDIRKRLKAEGYAEAELYGPKLIRQLRDLCEAARDVAPARGAD